jgi:glycosyltransferase involved in cell wall biosynthesis
MSKNRKKKHQPQTRKTPSYSKPFVIAADQKLPTICLSIIVKNESKVIERMLNSVWPILDYYCVVDTGSTDGTQDIVRKFFEGKGIRGKVIDHKWKNFEDARNTSIEESKKLLLENDEKNSFLFWIDADEQLIIDARFNKDMFKKSLLGFNGANVKVSYGSQNYFRMQFFSSDHPWRWYGPVHEVLVSDQPHKTGIAEGLTTLVTPDGNSWVAETIQQKYEGHAKILEDYVANDPNKDPRWVFYLAQSYRDAGTPENQTKSIEWYEKRATMMNGFWEEIYYSMLMAASLKGSLQYSIPEILDSYLKCGKANPHRAEHIIPVILHYHHMKEYDISYIFSSHAMKFAGKSPFPNSSLFIDPSIYDWKIYDLHSLNCYYSGRRSEASETFKKLLKAIDKGLVPQEEIPRLQENKKWFIK